MPYRLLLLGALLTALPVRSVAQADVETAPVPRATADSLDGPPFVTAKAWAVADGKTGKLLRGSNETAPRPMASTTKVMTARIVLQLAADDADVLDETLTVSEGAAKTPGSSAKLEAGERYAVRDVLYGLMLPSGNDAAVALAEHFGPRFAGKDRKEKEAVESFVAEMNRQAKALGLKETTYLDPNGLSSKNQSSARDLARLAHDTLRDERFRGYVGTRRHVGEATLPDGTRREAVWENTNRLLGIEGYDGVKTGTTTPAGACLIASGRRGGDHLIVVVLGSTSTDGRYVDARNLFRWAWRERERKVGVGGNGR